MHSASGMAPDVRSVRPVARLSVQIGSTLTRIARSSARRSDLAFGSVRSWGSTSVPPPSSGRASAPSTPRVWRRSAVSVGECHAVRVEARGVVVDEYPGVAPRAEHCRGPLVAISVGGLVTREDQPHRVVRRGGLERLLLLVVDHVVGWSGERVEQARPQPAGCSARRRTVRNSASEGAPVVLERRGIVVGCTTGHAQCSEGEKNPCTTLTRTRHTRKALACSPATTPTPR